MPSFNLKEELRSEHKLCIFTAEHHFSLKILAISFYVTGFGIRNSYLESLAAMAILGASVEK